MDYRSLAALIRSNYTPLAFNCSCKGEHDSCREAMNDAANYRQFDTVRRIANMIEGMEEI